MVAFGNNIRHMISKSYQSEIGANFSWRIVLPVNIRNLYCDEVSVVHG